MASLSLRQRDALRELSGSLMLATHATPLWAVKARTKASNPVLEDCSVAVLDVVRIAEKEIPVSVAHRSEAILVGNRLLDVCLKDDGMFWNVLPIIVPLLAPVVLARKRGQYD